MNISHFLCYKNYLNVLKLADMSVNNGLIENEFSLQCYNKTYEKVFFGLQKHHKSIFFNGKFNNFVFVDKLITIVIGTYCISISIIG